MEKKKLLLVAVSVGVFLVIVVSAAILVFSPSGQPAAGTVWRTNTVPENPPDLAVIPAVSDPVVATPVPSEQESRGVQPSPSGTNVQENNIYINGEPSEIAKNSATTVINITRPQAAAVPDETTSKPVVKPQAVVPSAASTPKSGQAQTPAKTPVSAKPSTSAKPVVPAKSAASAVNSKKDFWVQAGSYSTRERADTVKKTLHEKGITTIITNQTVGGELRYRVRAGPYTSRDEANAWLAMVKSINGFEGSQIWESAR